MNPSLIKTSQYIKLFALHHVCNILFSGDVDGSVEAILDILETYNGNSVCRLDLVHYGVGNVSETDVELADAFKG